MIKLYPLFPSVSEELPYSLSLLAPHGTWTPIGRGKKPFMQLQNPQVSRKQIEISSKDNISFHIRSCAVNESSLNGNPMEKGKQYVLKNGDIIHLLNSPSPKYGFRIQLLLEKEVTTSLADSNDAVLIDEIDHKLPGKRVYNSLSQDDESDVTSFLVDFSSESDYVGSFHDSDSETSSSPAPALALAPSISSSSSNVNHKPSVKVANNQSHPKAWKRNAKENFKRLKLEQSNCQQKTREAIKLIMQEWNSMEEEDQKSYYKQNHVDSGE